VLIIPPMRICGTANYPDGAPATLLVKLRV